MNEVTALTAFGMPGVWTWGFTEGWSQFYADSVATNHNAIGRGYETFGNATAETVERWLEPDRYKYAGQERHGDRVVPLAAGAEEAVPLVAARQHELHGDGRPRGAPVRRAERSRDAPELLAAGPERRGEGPHRGALRGRPARGAGRQGAARRARQPPARARNRGGARDGAVHRQGGDVSRRHVRREDGAALPGLRARPSPAAEVPGEDRVEAVRRRELGAAREPGRRREGDRGSGRAGGRDGSRHARRRVSGPGLGRGPRLPAEGHRAGGAPGGPHPPREVPRGGRRSRVRRGRRELPGRFVDRLAEARGSPAPWTAPRRSSASSSSRRPRRRT